MYKGVFTALVTPFANGKVDEKAFQNLVSWQVKSGVHGLIPCGTTGESATLSHEEHRRVVELCVDAAEGKVPVIAGTGSNSTQEAIELTRHAKEAGADAALIVAPYYNKPTQEGVYQHYKAIHDAVDIPIIIYNIPGRSVINITDQTIARLAKLRNIKGVKDATADLTRPLSLSVELEKAGVKGFSMLSGEDPSALAFNTQGGVGCMSVVSNVVPGIAAKMQDLWFAGKTTEACEISRNLFPLVCAMFVETNPVPAKYALSLMGYCSEEVRLPLVPLSEESRTLIRRELEVLQQGGLIAA